MVQSVEIFSIPLLNLGLLFGTFALLLGGAEIFTNSVEWLGHHLGESVLILVFGEIVPKSYGLGHAQSWSLRVAHPVSYVERALGPLVALFIPSHDGSRHSSVVTNTSRIPTLTIELPLRDGCNVRTASLQKHSISNQVIGGENVWKYNSLAELIEKLAIN